MKPRPGLQRNLTLGVLGYVLLLSVLVLLHGWWVNERAESLVWETLLETEMDHLANRVDEPGWHPVETGLMSFYDSVRGPAPPPALAALSAGVHDEVPVDGGIVVALVRELPGRRLVLALDIEDFEREERELGGLVLLSGLGMVLLLGLAVAWGVARLVRPLRQLAASIGGLRPDAAGQSIPLPRAASAELAVIADALNAYLRRHDEFVERERAFIDSASHELRTPIAVIAGAGELALSADMPPVARAQVQRIERTARSVEQLIEMLLVLAKDPARLARGSDRIALEQLLPEIADDHRHLLGAKALELELAPLPACEVLAPVSVVQATVGNLLRNAIENSDSGTIRLSLEPGGVVVIEDPGHGMSPEQISAIYARQARGEGRGGGGIGLELITRLCGHLGWGLDLRPRTGGRGTRARLDLGAARVGPLTR